MQDIETFLAELKVILGKYFSDCHVKYLLKTSRSLQANLSINKDTFIAVRYNSRNGRKDFALIHQGQRVLGYDNLKTWHIHPFNAPDTHLPCNEPLMEQIFKEMRAICDKLTKKSPNM